MLAVLYTASPTPDSNMAHRHSGPQQIFRFRPGDLQKSVLAAGFVWLLVAQCRYRVNAGRAARGQPSRQEANREEAYHGQDHHNGIVRLQTE